MLERSKRLYRKRDGKGRTRDETRKKYMATQTGKRDGVERGGNTGRGQKEQRRDERNEMRREEAEGEEEGVRGFS